MDATQIVIVVILFVGAILMGVGFRFLPKLLARALLTSLVFGFYAILGASVIELFVGSEATSVLFFVFFAGFALLTVLSFFAVYRIEDEERARKLLLLVAVIIFSVGVISYLAVAIHGMVNDRATHLPGHICRQTAYLFPIAYFMRDKIRKFILPGLCFIALAGGLVTIVTPGNLAVESDFPLWPMFDTVFTHLILVWVPVIIYATGEMRARLFHIPFGLLIFLLMICFGAITNLIVYAQVGEQGFWAWNMQEIPDNMHPAVFFTIGIVVMCTINAIIVGAQYFLEKRKSNLVDLRC